MKTLSKPSWGVLRAYQWLAGTCDVATGLSLVIAPAWTLHRMGVRELPESLEFVSWIGIFVLGVGLAYGTATRQPFSSVDSARWKTVWLLTAISRTLVAAFVGWEVAGGRLETAWLSVCITDAGLAGFQWWGLRRGWLDHSTVPIVFASEARSRVPVDRSAATRARIRETSR